MEKDEAGSNVVEDERGWFARLHDRFLGVKRHEGRFDVQPTAESHFSWLRTRMSLERTLMSWVRTSTALIGFGFTIVQFFHSNLISTSAVPFRHPEMPRYMGLALIAAGVLALLVALWQYRAFANYLWSHDFASVAGPARAPVETPIFAVAICLLLIGCYAFLAVLIRAI
ncbi:MULTISPECIES: YidH family protein [Oxalobacteraceae]|uniref:DUF202 domain-containing protein n=1 Tax=Herminiimonas contaminans TaxID=1111140 RepID=A0ABS0ESC0_9BURK|nr:MULTISPECIES: DUF202 domain-containing protein [Oxalobacteraceae]MBF8177745.1 DUF202 domain-containing protein [Herminiimonas contaminans]